MPISQPPQSEEANVSIKVSTDYRKAKAGQKALSTSDSAQPEGAVTDQSHEAHSLSAHYENVSLQLLTISSTLYSKAHMIYKDWATAAEWPISLLWTECWKTSLQGMARLATDCRRKVRAHALDCLGVGFRYEFLWLNHAAYSRRRYVYQN